MRVAIDGAFLGAARGGDETFLRGVLSGLVRCRAADDEFPLVLRPGQVPEEVRTDPGFPVTPVPARPGPWHFGTTLPRTLRRLQPELALTVTHAPLTGRVPYAVTIGDLSFVHRPQDYPRATAARLRTLVPLHVRRARVVVVPSEYTRTDVVASYGIDPARVHVVPNRVAPRATLSSAAERRADDWIAERGVRGPFLLYLGNLHPRKNVPRLIRTFLALRRRTPALRDHQLVVAGGRWWSGQAEQTAAAGNEHVRFLGRVSDDVRGRLLGRASALAYLSLFEGFGLPPVEAMAYGTPVVTSRVTSLPEVCAGAAVLVDPDDEDAIAAGLERVLTDEALRTELRAAGPLVAAGYDAERVGRATLSAFRYALDLPPAAPDQTAVGHRTRRSSP